MIRNLPLLLLLSLCSQSMCQNYSYHFIDIKKTWEDAQKYCRANYTDLATLYDQRDDERICGGKADCPGSDGAWIGLRFNESIGRTWHWSQPGLEFHATQTKWDQNQPNNANAKTENRTENCVSAINKMWHDADCESALKFICYNNSSRPYVSNNPKRWLEALQFCRENHIDLIGPQQIPDGLTGHHWIGIFRDSWQWSDGSNSSFRNWNEMETILNNGWDKKNQCARLGEQKKWKSADCTEQHAFICYDDQMILIKENKTFVEALLYCRRHHGDLAVMNNIHQRRMVQERAKMADTEYVWVGLHYTCFFEEWIWVNGYLVGKGKWNDKEPHDCGLNGAVERDGCNKWFGKSSEEKYNFVCSSSWAKSSTC